MLDAINLEHIGDIIDKHLMISRPLSLTQGVSRLDRVCEEGAAITPQHRRAARRRRSSLVRPGSPCKLAWILDRKR